MHFTVFFIWLTVAQTPPPYILKWTGLKNHMGKHGQSGIEKYHAWVCPRREGSPMLIDAAVRYPTICMHRISALASRRRYLPYGLLSNPPLPLGLVISTRQRTDFAWPDLPRLPCRNPQSYGSESRKNRQYCLLYYY